ncbi:MAG TPA: NAD(P)-dependent oxidoreductase [Croceibacterium sp.]|nr:NAD(P)-dependent oxidoreductase [Croceibacterium sp.]
MARLNSLPLFHRVAGRPVIVHGEGEAAAARRRLVERAGGVVVGEEDADARLAFVALDAPEAAAARLRARGVLVNVADRPDLCDFTVPSLLDRDPVLIAVGTGGASAGLAKHVRLRLEGLLPTGLGRLAEALFGARDALRARVPDAAERRRALDAALQPGGPLDPLGEGGAERVAAWLENSAGPRPLAPVTLTIAGDDPDDLSLRQARLLGRADFVLFEPGVAAAVLDRARADAARFPLPYDGPPLDGLVVVLRRS